MNNNSSNFKKIAKKLLWIPLPVICYFILSLVLYDVETKVLLLLTPVLVAAVAKYISHMKGDEGEMSRAYKDEYEENKRLYIIFCISTVILPLMVVVSENIPYDVRLLSDNAEKIVGIIWLVLTGICGLGWMLTEVIRDDFPWGLFRLIERLFYLALMIAAAFVGANFIAMAVERYPGFFQAVILLLIPVAFIAIAAFFITTMRELLLIITYPDPKKRETFKEDEDRRVRQNLEESKKFDRWFFAKRTDKDGTAYYTIDPKTHKVVDLWVDDDGILIDDKCNEYPKK